MSLFLRNILMILILPLLLIACPKKDTKTSVSAGKDNSSLISIAKIISHPSLDATEKGIIDEINASGLNVRYDIQNANGDMNTASSIANKFKSENADISVGIATPMAVALANTIKDKPVLFAAVTDPVDADLVETVDSGYKNITGLADTIPIKEQLAEFHKLYPFKKLGFIYTNSETNAISMAKTTASVCKEMGIEFLSTTISNPSEVKQAGESLVGRVDMFYVTTDNSLVAGVSSLIETARANNIPVFSGDITSSLNGGVVYVLGFNYYLAGRLAGEMIVDILNGKKPADMPVRFMKDKKYYDKLIDLDVAKKLNITIPEKDIEDAKFIFQNNKLTERKIK